MHRLAVTLVSEGMLEQNPENEKYRLGIMLFRLGALVRHRMNLSNEAKPHLVELARAYRGDRASGDPQRRPDHVRL